jgi:uncharacterized protein
MTIYLSWNQIDDIVSNLSKKVEKEGKPEIIIGIQRGGLVPAVMLSHSLGVRDVLTLSISRTIDDRIDSQKIEPYLQGEICSSTVERLSLKDVLLVDDIVGTGITLQTAQKLLRKSSSLSRFRSLVCIANLNNWDKSNINKPSDQISYIGKEVREWVVFPWENYP